MDFKSTFIFCAFKTWTTDFIELALNNRGTAIITSGFISGTAVISQVLLDQSWFGTTYLVLLLVHLTLFANAVSGVVKNKKKANIFFCRSQQYEPNTKEWKLNTMRWKAHEFDIKKLYFVFFKSFAFLSYLLVVKALTSDHPTGAEWFILALSFGTESLIRIPIFLFWYYEFKSIGENSEYIFNQKASIFRIIERIVEPKILKMYGNTTPTDGHNPKNPQ